MKNRLSSRIQKSGAGKHVFAEHKKWKRCFGRLPAGLFFADVFSGAAFGADRQFFSRAFEGDDESAFGALVIAGTGGLIS